MILGTLGFVPKTWLTPLGMSTARSLVLIDEVREMPIIYADASSAGARLLRKVLDCLMPLRSL